MTDFARVRDVHTEDIQDIISAPPSWLLRWGITVFFAVLVMIIGLSEFIKYPDTIKTVLVINSLNSPKPIITKMSGKLIKLLVNDNTRVKYNQPLAYIESTAKHEDVLLLLKNCEQFRSELLTGALSVDFKFGSPVNLQLGELQSSYQQFYEVYLSYKSSINNGYFLKRKAYLMNDLQFINRQKTQLFAQRDLQERDYKLAADEYNVHKLLTDQKVETSMEFKQQESKLLEKKVPIIQTESSLITTNNNYTDKEKEIGELDNQISEERAKFVQALSSLISNMADWKNKYVLTASQSGKVSFVGIIQENEILNANQEVFYINSGNEHFFGEVNIPQNNMGKIKVGQKVLVKLKSYPYEEYGLITGELTSISDIPLKDSIFIAKVNFNSKSFSRLKRGVHLKYGMLADAEIITENSSLLSRLFRNLTRISTTH